MTQPDAAVAGDWHLPPHRAHSADTTGSVPLCAVRALLQRWWKLLVVVVVLIGAAVVIAVVGLPTTDGFRAWSRTLGPWFVIAFVAVHALLCITPIPRTIFTLAAGALFGAVGGVAIAVGSSVAAAVAAFLIVRYVAPRAWLDRLNHPAVRAVRIRLERRGWLAVGSLRLIAPVPFSVVNYVAGLSPVRLLPFAIATLVGMLPGTIAVVALGNLVSGRPNGWGLALSGVAIGIGVLGIVADAFIPSRPESKASTIDSA